MFWLEFLTSGGATWEMGGRGRHVVETGRGEWVEFRHTSAQIVVMVRLILLIHRREVLLSTILVKIFE